jgi:hypothetical protein
MITGKSAPRQEPAGLIASAARSRPNIDRRQESEPELVKPLVLSTPTAVVGNSLRPVFEPTWMSSKAEHTVCLHRSTPSSWARLGREREPGPSHPRGRARVCTSARARIVELTTDFTPVTGSCPRDPSARSGFVRLGGKARSFAAQATESSKSPACLSGRSDGNGRFVFLKLQATEFFRDWNKFALRHRRPGARRGRQKYPVRRCDSSFSAKPTNRRRTVVTAKATSSP